MLCCVWVLVRHFITTSKVYVYMKKHNLAHASYLDLSVFFMESQQECNCCLFLDFGVKCVTRFGQGRWRLCLVLDIASSSSHCRQKTKDFFRLGTCSTGAPLGPLPTTLNPLHHLEQTCYNEGIWQMYWSEVTDSEIYLSKGRNTVLKKECKKHSLPKN